MKKQSFTWLRNGFLLGAVFFIAILLMKPIGVSTQYSVTAGMIQSAVDSDLIYVNEDYKSGYGSELEYFDRKEGKMAGNIKNPINYSYIFALAIFTGGFIGRLLLKQNKETEEKNLVPVGFEGSKNKKWIRFGISFVAGFIGLFGARLAGGCTSGHMMSGMTQTALSGYLFAAMTFAVAIPTALVLYRRK